MIPPPVVSRQVVFLYANIVRAIVNLIGKSIGFYVIKPTTAGYYRTTNNVDLTVGRLYFTIVFSLRSNWLTAIPDKRNIRFMIRSTTIFIVTLVLFGFSTSTFAQTEEVEKQEREEVNAFFEKAHSALVEALDMFDKQEQLPGQEDLAFYDFLSRTKESQQEKIEDYLDAAAEALGISNMSERRNKIANMREEISDQRQSLSTYQRKRISAPETQGLNPLTVTKAKYDKKIKDAQERIAELEQSVEREKEQLIGQLNDIGMKLDPESADILLESATGDEFIRVSIVFDNAKRMARELEELTEKTGEDLETAKRYYGVYLMLLKVVDQLQNKFVEKVDSEYYPGIDAYAQRARSNIAQAKKAIKLGGNENVLNSNIESNQLMYEAAMIYKQGLSHQKHQMMMANLECKKNILTAANTYKTVELSKDVAKLMATSRRAFDSITSLSVPELRPFENQKMKDAFQTLIRDLKN